MKNLKLLFITLILPINSYCQDIIYDVETNDFTESTKKIKKLENGSEGKVIIKHFNPFMYNFKIDQSHLDNASKLPEFLTSIPTLFGIKTNLEGFEKLSPDELNSFYNLYEKYIKVYIRIKQKTLDCDKLNELIDDIDNQSLVKSYIDNQNKLSNISSKEILDLELLVKNIKNYLETNKNCRSVVAKYKISGESTTIKISLITRDEAKGFETPLTDIFDSKTIKTIGKKKVRFSSGLMLSKNIEPDYYIKTTDSLHHEIATEKKGEYLPGISLLAHIEFNDTFYLNLGGGLTIEAVPHFLVGGSYKIPDSNIFFNVGYGWAYRKTLSDNLKLDTVYSSPPSSIKTKKKLEGDFWFGLSYQL